MSFIFVLSKDSFQGQGKLILMGQKQFILGLSELPCKLLILDELIGEFSRVLSLLYINKLQID